LLVLGLLTAVRAQIKRQVFPAFFQLSDLELATLLSKCRDVSCISSFLFQCFDNVGRIVFGSRNAFQDVLQVTSRAYGDAETISMGKNLKARGPVEQWLAAVEKRLAEQLRRSTKQAIELLSRHDDSALSPNLDTSHFPVQSLLLADRVVRCMIIDAGLREMSTTGASTFDRVAGQLDSYSSTVRHQTSRQEGGLRAPVAALSPREIALHACLLLQEIQYRDALASHVASQQSAVSALPSGGLAIDWEQQLKYRMDDATTVGHECHVEMNTLRTPYGFSYLSPSQDTVVTPGSLRSLFTLFACVRHAQGCVLTGPSESGKRTLSMQVSATLGRRAFSAAVTSHTHATRLLVGALHSGGTFCASVQLSTSLEACASLLKTLASTLTAVEHAVQTKNPIVGLHRSPVAFLPGTAMLVLLPATQRSVIDAESAARWTEALSRFVLVGLDWTYILEALLLSKGFVEPRTLAKKLLVVWEDARSAVELARCKAPEAEASPFTFSALKAIIADVDPRKGSSASVGVYQQVQLQDAILQYFRVRVGEKPLNALTAVAESAFPCLDKSVSTASHHTRAKEPVLSPELHESVLVAVRELHFVPRKLLLDAVASLAEALAARKSAVLVGASGVGKTAVYQVLARALELCLQRRSQGGAPAVQEPSNAQPAPVRASPVALARRSNSYLAKAEKNLSPRVALRVVLPMALTVTQLYGGVSLDGHGRIPSLLGQLVREAQESYVPSCEQAAATPTQSLLDLPNQVWVVFDDALDLRWLEGLLAVLTAERQPLLAFEAGEFMTLPPNLRVLFEVAQLRDATPTFLHANAVLPLPDEIPEDSAAKTAHRRAKSTDSSSRMPVATAYLHRYLALQREQAALQAEALKPSSWTPANTFSLVERWLLKTSLLAELTAALDGSVALSPLQRVTNLASMLQALLSTVCALPEPSPAVLKDQFATGAGTPTHFAQELPYAQIRVDMALVYSLLWGFAACTGSALQRQLSDLVRRAFDHLTPAWIHGGADVNLFETLMDPAELRFVPVVGASSQPALPLQVASSSSLSTLFVPTVASLMVHAAIREALRSGRGVLLLGGDSSRRTTLARNFLGQLAVIRSILAAGGVSSTTHNAGEDAAKAPKPVDAKTNEAETLASVKRLRLRQISLVTWMAFRLQKESSESLQASGSASVASLASTPDNRTAASIVEAEEGLPLAIAPSMDLAKAAMVRQFDRGDVIPFFFAMPRSSSTDVATDLASCLERMLQRERTGVFEPPPGKTALLVIDDLHLAAPGASASSQRPRYPSVYALLRYVHERGLVYRGASCLPTAVENLMLLASMRVEHHSSSSAAQDEPLRKLTAKLFPVVAPSCGLEELHHIFGQALQSHWAPAKAGGSGALSTTVRYALPLVVAATTVLWDRLRGTYQFCLQDLARVYEGLAGVGPSLLPDVETLLRLWTHECNQTLREPSMGVCSPLQDDQVARDVARMRSLVAQVTQRRASARASRLSLGPAAGVSFVVASKRQSVQAGRPASDESASPAALLALFAARSSSATPSGRNVSVKYSRISEQHHDAIAGGLWANVPANVYYSGGSILASTQVEGGSTSSDASEASQRVHRRSSASFMRQQSLEAGLGDGDAPHRTLGKHGRWIYAEISFEDDSDAVATATVQVYYRDLRTFSSVADPKPSRTLSLPRDVSPVPFKLAQVVARIDRVFARPAARLILLDSTNSAVDTLLRFATVSRTPDFPANGTILTLSGLLDDPNITTSCHDCVTMRWRRLLLELYERVGVAGQEATLVVKRLDLLPAGILNQLQALMTTGEVPGALSLEQQVHLATRVCDERLLALKAKHAQQVAQIRCEAEAARDQALAVLHQKQRDAPTTPLLDAFQQVEARYQRDLRSKLARVDLRWQQDSDDLRREREVESESVAATVMALTRPLGVTSGKWASAVSRMCSKLRVVLVIDKKHEQRVRSASPGVFATCDVVSVPQLDRDALRTLVYGHFHAQVEQLLHDRKSGATPGLLDFAHQLQRSLWTLVCMATDMHLAVVGSADDEGQEDGPPATRAFLMASVFAKLVVEGYMREEAARAKASWFLELSNRLDRDLGALRSSDVLLSEQLSSVDQQLTTHAVKLVEQKEDAERIRAIMQRFQVTADEQIHVTNEAQEVAQRELREPMACLEEANRALLLVDRRHIVEIKSFVSPPPLVHLVLGAVCVLFQIEPSWESARRLLLGDANVVQTLLQFNKDAVPAATLARLEAEYLRDERFCREQVERQSVAASSMVGWVRAIHQYASARQQVQPTLDKLERAQSRLHLIMQEFQVSKQRVVEADEAWQATQAAIDAASARKEALSGEISSLEARCDSGGLALEALQEDRTRQQEAASASAMRRGFSLASWNALLSAGSLVYACELSSCSRRRRVFQSWEAAYSSYGGLTPGCPPTSTCCTFFPSIAVVLKGSTLSSAPTKETPLTALFDGDYPEDGDAEAEDATALVTGAAGLGFSRRRLRDASVLSLIAATSTLPVMLITRYSPELEELLVTCARRVWHWPQLDMVYARAPDFDDVFRSAARLGHQLLVLDVEPRDSEPTEEHTCLRAALAWTAARIEGVEHLLVPQRGSGTDLEEEKTDLDRADTIALHPSFRLVLTSQASRAAFDDVLDRIPALDAALHRSDVAGVLLDKIWSSSASDSAEGSGDAGGLRLKQALRGHARLAQEYAVLQANLTKLLEAAAVTSQFPLTQTQALRDRLASTQAARQGLSEQRREIRDQLRLVERQCSPLARAGAAVFNAFNVTVSGSRARAPSLPLTLPVFLPILLDVVAASPPATPATNGATCPPSSHRRSLFATSPSGLTLAASSRGHVSSSGVSPEVLATLLTRVRPLVPPHGDWHRFLLLVVTALQDPQPAAHASAGSSANQVGEPISRTPRSVGTILLQAKLSSASQDEAALSAVTVEGCEALAMSASWPDLQRRLVGLIFNGVKTDSSSGIDALLQLAMRGASSRSERLRVGLVLFPELAQHVCDRVLAGYGVPLSVHRRGSSAADPTAPQEAASQHGLWLQALRSLPEQTAVLVLTKHDFRSFAFARRVFFHGLDNAAAVQVRVLQFLAERTFGAVQDGPGKPAASARVNEQAAPLDQLYVFPRCLDPLEDDDEAAVRQLLLMAEDFQQVARMEKTQFEALEAAPLAVVSMKNAAPEDWEGLFQILNRSYHRTSSAAFQRHGGGSLVSDALAQGSQGGDASGGTAVGGSRRRSSLSMVRRLSAADLVTPTYPRLVAAVDTLEALPAYLRANALCFRDEDEDEAGGDGPTAASFCKCFQSAVLRLALSPCAQAFSAFTRPREDARGEARLPPPDLWQVVTGLVLFHSVLGFRFRVLQSTYVGALPPRVFHYGDEVFLTAINQSLAALTHKQQPRRAGRVVERRVYQQVVLSAYARVAAGSQELAFLEKLFAECIQLIRCGQPSVDDSGVKSRGSTASSFRRLSALPASGSTLLLAFLAFPSEAARRADLSMRGWLELVWTYSTRIDQQMNGKLRALLLGHDASRRGSLGDSAKDVLTPDGVRVAYCPPPQWMRAFGWAPEHHTASLGDVAELTARIPVRTAVDVVQALLCQALPPRCDLESWRLVEDSPDVEEEGPVSSRPGSLAALRAMASVYNLQIKACSDVLEAILARLQELEERADATARTLREQLFEEDDESEEADREDADEDKALRLVDITDVPVRQQIAAILSNEIPPDIRAHSWPPPPPTTSLHDLLQHFQDWYSHLRPHDSADPPRWWLPGVLASGLSLARVLESNQPSVGFTLRLPPPPEADRPLPEKTFAILDGLVLLGASWNQDSQRLEPIHELETRQRVQLVCFATSSDRQACPLSLLASHDGALLLECPLQADSSRMGPFATPLLVPVGSHFR
jgi:hypothetical protein